MPVVPEYKSNGVIVWHSGFVTGADLILANQKVYSHKYEEPLLFQVLDFSETKELKVTSSEVGVLAHMDRGRIKEVEQFACVVAPTSTMYGFSRQWNIQAEQDGFHTNVVHSMDEAVAWLESKGVTLTLEK